MATKSRIPFTLIALIALTAGQAWGMGKNENKPEKKLFLYVEQDDCDPTKLNLMKLARESGDAPKNSITVYKPGESTPHFYLIFKKEKLYYERATEVAAYNKKSKIISYSEQAELNKQKLETAAAFFFEAADPDVVAFTIYRKQKDCKHGAIDISFHVRTYPITLKYKQLLLEKHAETRAQDRPEYDRHSFNKLTGKPVDKALQKKRIYIASEPYYCSSDKDLGHVKAADQGTFIRTELGKSEKFKDYTDELCLNMVKQEYPVCDAGQYNPAWKTECSACAKGIKQSGGISALLSFALGLAQAQFFEEWWHAVIPTPVGAAITYWAVPWFVSQCKGVAPAKNERKKQRIYGVLGYAGGLAVALVAQQLKNTWKMRMQKI
ncbi:MAG: hypothetical protein M1549_04075 [Candidatus Dependentiae bacterium]|nr:hypothetical protein [Candidatus Dependentiae bacterium]